uniref:Uncharacterized protein n=1 Tax=Theileria annulata TaxID=5874 RepID=A0A3B0NDI0_THEAN
MEISTFFILNIISVILIKRCLNIKEEFPKNPLDSTANQNLYKSVDLSDRKSLDSINLVNSEINGVDTILLFPKKGCKIAELSISNVIVWSSNPGQYMLFGTISTNPNSKLILINITVNASKQFSNVLILGKEGKYEQIPSFQFMDYLSELRTNPDPKPFVLNLDSNSIPEAVDHTVRLGNIPTAIFIPHRGYKATKIVIGGQTLFDAKSSNLHVPIAIGYEYKRNSYLNFITVNENNDFGNIYQYNVSESRVKFLQASDIRFIYQVFTFEMEEFINSGALLEPSKEIGSTADVEHDQSSLTFDIKDVDEDLFNLQRLRILNLTTLKYTPIRGTITSVVYGTKTIWSSNSHELSCKDVMIHYSNNVAKSIELKIVLATNSIESRIIPYKTIIPDDTSSHTNIHSDLKLESVEVPSSSKLRRSKSESNISYVKPKDKRVERELTPPNTPTCSREDLSTPPNSPARTPPPSPARTPSNSLSTEEPFVNRVSSGESHLYVLDSDNKLIKHDDDDDYLDDLFDDEDMEDEYFDSEHYLHDPISSRIHSKSIHKHHVDEDAETTDDEEAADEVDISSRKSMEKMYIVDGTDYVPFIFLLAYQDKPIRVVKDGSSVIWHSESAKQMLRYATIYLYNNMPVALALLVIDKPTFRQRYFVKDDGTWHEVDIYEYTLKTPYEFAGKQDPKEKDKLVKETPKITKSVLHVSPMFPVILGSIFLFVSVSSLLFILFFC